MRWPLSCFGQIVDLNMEPFEMILFWWCCLFVNFPLFCCVHNGYMVINFEYFVWFGFLCIIDIVSRLGDRLLIACICAEIYWLLSCFGVIVLIMWSSELILWWCLLLIRNLPFYLLICCVPSNYRGISNENFCTLVSLYIWFGVEVEEDILMVSIYA